MAQWITATHPSPDSESQTLQALQQTDELSDTTVILPDITGIDIKAGLARLEGDRSHYRNLLILFYNNQKNFMDKFRAALASHDDLTAFREAHTLKSVAGTMGLDALAETAKELEQACSKWKEQGVGYEAIEVKLEHVELAFNPVMEELKLFVVKENKPVEEASAIDEKELTSDFLHLTQLLAEGSTDARKVIETITQNSTTNIQSLPEWEALKNQISNYDYEGATVTLNKLLEHQGIK